MSDAPPKKWYVLYTMPQHEKKISKYLEKKNLAHYLPLIRKRRQWSDRIKMVDFPLFPGYLFAHMNYAQDSIHYLQHPGALGFVKEDGVPAFLSNEQIDNLRLFVEHSKTEVQADPTSDFSPGQEVEIQRGPLKGVRGVVSKAKNVSRIFIQIPLLNQTVSTEIDVMDVEKIV